MQHAALMQHACSTYHTHAATLHVPLRRAITGRPPSPSRCKSSRTRRRSSPRRRASSRAPPRRCRTAPRRARPTRSRRAARQPRTARISPASRPHLLRAVLPRVLHLTRISFTSCSHLAHPNLLTRVALFALPPALLPREVPCNPSALHRCVPTLATHRLHILLSTSSRPRHTRGAQAVNRLWTVCSSCKPTCNVSRGRRGIC